MPKNDLLDMGEDDDLLDMDDDLLDMGGDDLLDMDNGDDLLDFGLPANTRDWPPKWTADPREFEKEVAALVRQSRDFEVKNKLVMFEGWTAADHFKYWLESFKKKPNTTFSVMAMSFVYQMRAGKSVFVVKSKEAANWSCEATVCAVDAAGDFGDLLIKLPAPLEHLTNQTHLKGWRNVNFNLRDGLPTDPKEPFFIPR